MRHMNSVLYIDFEEDSPHQNLSYLYDNLDVNIKQLYIFNV